MGTHQYIFKNFIQSFLKYVFKLIFVCMFRERGRERNRKMEALMREKHQMPSFLNILQLHLLLFLYR